MQYRYKYTSSPPYDIPNSVKASALNVWTSIWDNTRPKYCARILDHGTQCVTLHSSLRKNIYTGITSTTPHGARPNPTPCVPHTNPTPKLPPQPSRSCYLRPPPYQPCPCPAAHAHAVAPLLALCATQREMPFDCILSHAGDSASGARGWGGAAD